MRKAKYSNLSSTILECKLHSRNDKSRIQLYLSSTILECKYCKEINLFAHNCLFK